MDTLEMSRAGKYMYEKVHAKLRKFWAVVLSQSSLGNLASE